MQEQQYRQQQQYYRKKQKRKKLIMRRFLISLTLVILLAAVSLCAYILIYGMRSVPDGSGGSIVTVRSPKPGESAMPEYTPESTPEPTPEPTPVIPNPYAVAGSRPEDFGLQTAMEFNGQPISSYQRTIPIDFGETNEYTNMDGIVTFRGNNFRDSAAYGTVGASISGNLEIVWKTDLPERIARVNSDKDYWFGSGWTGQPLVVRWDNNTRSHMNMLDSKKYEDDLVEVILGTEGAAIYFVDLKDGKPTRNKILERWTFKGAGALDPRGYPLYFVGSGDASEAGSGQNMIFSLTNTARLYEYGQNDPFRDRDWIAYDPSTIVHAATDTVTYAAETNVIYQFTLNTRYDAQTGSISVNPTDIFKWKYTTNRSRAAYTSGADPGNNKVYLGFESSPIFWREYMYVADNGGNLFCINVNTFEVIWMCDTWDDTNGSPVFELDEANRLAYIYIGTSARATRNDKNIAYIPFWKINAVTGEKIWETTGYNCHRPSDSGGIQATAALGKHQLGDLVYIPFANVVENGNKIGSYLVAYDKVSGNEVWKRNFKGQCWSSPVDVYDDSGRGYIVFGSASYSDSEGKAVGGFVTLLDGRTGEILSQVELRGHVEASPVVYKNMIVIGTRGQVLYGIRIK